MSILRGGVSRPGISGGIPVDSRNGAVLGVDDLADVTWSEDKPEYITCFNGKRALLLTATQGNDQDVTKLSAPIAQELKAFERTLPAGVTLIHGFDQSANVKSRLGELAQDFVLTIALMTLTLLPLGPSAACVAMMAIPLSLLIGIAVLSGLGHALNQLAISGFVVALGLLFDDSIVVVENIARWLRDGKNRAAAAVGPDRADDADALIADDRVIAIVFGLAFTLGAAAFGQQLFSALGGQDETRRHALTCSA